jgi:23S rRNA pseudoU1915 N3-methylase RlmH
MEAVKALEKRMDKNMKKQVSDLEKRMDKKMKKQMSDLENKMDKTAAHLNNKMKNNEVNSFEMCYLLVVIRIQQILHYTSCVIFV